MTNEQMLKAAYLMGRNAWCPAGIKADAERAERDWQKAREKLLRSSNDE